MGKLIFKDQIYTFGQIQAGEWQENDPYIVQSLTFCKDWLNGKQEFDMQTSGSTGLPKKLTLYRSQMEISAAATKAFFKIEKGVSLLVCINTEMIGGKMMLVRGLCWHADIHLCLLESNPFNQISPKLNIGFCAMVPLQVEACLAEDFSSKILSKIGVLIIGGAPASDSLMQKIKSNGINAFQTYGMTETVSHIALAKIDGQELRYQTLPNVTIGTDEEKRLWIEAPMAKEKRLQTNDLVEIVGDGIFRWIGRADFTINSGGIKIQAELLEAEISKYVASVFGNIAYFLFGQEDEKLGQKMVLFLETSASQKHQAQKLLGILKDKMKKYHSPKEVFLIEEFVKTTSGKINRTKTAQLCF
ncbi:AMP-binding protein [Belliella marina]|uniref:AMP-binding protein n=1 Tax=Belliella marina TaxID=1644146 RepID=A0ABW4VMU0_9BACT